MIVNMFCLNYTQKIGRKKKSYWKILTTTKNSYTFEFGMVGSDAKQRALPK
jgi:hypothetical protein